MQELLSQPTISRATKDLMHRRCESDPNLTIQVKFDGYQRKHCGDTDKLCLTQLFFLDNIEESLRKFAVRADNTVLVETIGEVITVNANELKPSLKEKPKVSLAFIDKYLFKTNA